MFCEILTMTLVQIGSLLIYFDQFIRRRVSAKCVSAFFSTFKLTVFFTRTQNRLYFGSRARLSLQIGTDWPMSPP